MFPTIRFYTTENKLFPIEYMEQETMKSFTNENLHEFIKKFATVGKKIEDIRGYEQN